METAADLAARPLGQAHYTYKVSQLWAGWWGGWGSNGHINERLNDIAADGWRLVDSRSAIRLWFWIIPRPKVLLFFEKQL